MLCDEEPVEVSWSYYPHSLVAGTALSRCGRIRGGAPAVLADLGHLYELKYQQLIPSEGP
ncbi:hypothetical protein ABZU32_08900 [Sphaerisporangium sp. NPDC005288]|uniref:hypothetical protein n=1 Tax=Sphaerisporangium sp. NPDC005288 TaxID=3155114 RepID=UPI0033BA6E5B